RPPAPKAGALTGLRYTPKCLSQKRCKGRAFYFNMQIRAPLFCVFQGKNAVKKVPGKVLGFISVVSTSGQAS
ncbi:hypothetical protein, partial [Bacteroides mediterraneensis]|uniref:hypothetical protein n=1 Tax=Bacteroides mediterraneensis TaxID=1841856 RepID=UPI0026E92C77